MTIGLSYPPATMSGEYYGLDVVKLHSKWPVCEKNYVLPLYGVLYYFMNASCYQNTQNTYPL